MTQRRVPRSANAEVQEVFKSIWDHIDRLLGVNNLDFHLRRIINASPAEDDNDYVTLGQVNELIDNATIGEGTGGSSGGGLEPVPPGAGHAVTHQDGGSDEINVTGLQGLLLTPQVPRSHAESHENGGPDEINLDGLSGTPEALTAHAADPDAHKGQKNSIEIDSGDLQLVNDEASPGNNKVYGTDGSGSKGWKDDPAGVGGNGITELTGNVLAGPGSGAQAASIVAFTGDVTKTAGGTALTLANSGVTPGTYGDNNEVPQITVDAKGRVTSVSSIPISSGGGGWEHIGTWTHSVDVSEVDFDVTGYSAILISFIAVTASSSGTRAIRVSTDGSTYFSGASDYVRVDPDGTVAVAAQFSVHITASALARYGQMHIIGLHVSGQKKPMIPPNRGTGGYFDGSTNPIVKVRAFNTAGNLTGGSIVVYGIAA